MKLRKPVQSQRGTARRLSKDSIQFAELLSDVVAQFDPQYRHLYVNSAVERFTGRPAQEFVGKTNLELGMPAELVSRWDQTLGDVFKTGQPSESRFSFSGPDGTHHFISRAVPEKDSRGHVASVIIFSRDVTTETLQAMQLQSAGFVPPGASLPARLSIQPMTTEMAAEHFRAIVESSDDAIIGKTLDGIVTSWNRGAESIFGYSESEMLGQSLLLLFPHDRVNDEKFFLQRLLLGEKIDHFETTRIHKDGHPVQVSVTISPIRDRHGRVVGASKVARDITLVTRERERLKLALNTASNGLWDWDLKADKVSFSLHYDQICGLEPSNDLHDFEFFKRTVHPDDLPRALQAIDDYLTGQCKHIEFEYRLMTRQGFNGIWMMAHGQAVEHDLHGAPSRIVGTLADISKSKQADADLLDREKRLSRVIEGSDQGYWDWNVQANSLIVSQRWESMLGYEPGEMDVSQGRYAQYVHPDDFPMVMDFAQLHLDGKRANLDAEIRCLTKSGHWRWIQTRGRIVEWDAEGRPLMVSGTHTDIAERKDYELSQKEAATVFDNSYEGIMVVSPDGLITKINPAFSRITGYAPHEAIGKSPKILSSGRHPPGFFKELWASLSSDGFWTGEIWNRRKSGDIYAQLLSISAVLDYAGLVTHYIGIFSDISILKAHEAELDRVAHFDPLTGVPNRRLLADRLEQSIARANRSQTSLAVCYLDLDGFKVINDAHGHAAGDQLLIGVTESMKQILRSEDTLARLGGDEFVLLLSDIGPPEECSMFLERILNVIGTPLTIEGHTIAMSASIGVSLYPLDHSDADTLLRHADQAMYRAKEAGKNRFHLFDPDSDRKAQMHRQFVDRVQMALQREEFCLHYQPKVDLATGEIIGVEALIRWQHPERGLLSPAEFLPHIANSSVDHAVGIWVLDRALAQAAQWQSQGHPVKVSVNIGANHLLRPDFLSGLQNALARQPCVSADSLELEVLESAAINDMGLAAKQLASCHGMGVLLALDDFGTGYSSLTHLRKLPVDCLKIDQSFVRDMLRDPEDHDIVEGVIRLANAFNRKVIAEGVETLEHGAALLALGCRLAQGYGIARPMPPDDFPAWSVRWTTQATWRQLGKALGT